jgi:hypothetical protein
MPPLGFTDEKQFLEAAHRFRVAAGAEDALVGIRGSASTGRSGQTGENFGAASDLDFSLVSGILYQQALAAGAQGSNGAFRLSEIALFNSPVSIGRLKPRQQKHNVCLRRLPSSPAKAGFVLLQTRFQPPG